MGQIHPKIVVVASDPKTRALLTRHLRAQAYRAVPAKDWHACLAHLKKSPDLLLLDLSLEKAERVVSRAKGGKGNGHGIPVLAFDLLKNSLREIKAFRLGIDGYVGKPFIKEELMAAVTPLVEREKIELSYTKLVNEERKKRKSIERELKSVTDFTERIASHIPLSIIIVNGEREIVYANKNFCRAMGMSQNRLLGHSLREVFPETLYGPIELFEKIDSVLAGGRPTPRFSMAYRGADYTYRVSPVTLRMGSDDPTRSRNAMLLIENISELKTMGEKVRFSEEKYRLLFENSPDGILVTRPRGGRIFEANRRAEQLLRKKRSQLKKYSLLGLFPGLMRRDVKKRLWKLSRGTMELPDLSWRLKGGQIRVLNATTSRMLRRGEEALLCILKDVTEKKFLENQIRQSEKMSLLGQFTAGAAHEINNPLSIISSNAQYLLSEIKEGKMNRQNSGEILEGLNLIDREARYCGGIIKNLLTYTHTAEEKKEAVNLGTVLNDCFKIVERQIRLSNVTMEIKIDPGLPPILGNANRLQQVFMNLIWNAQGAMPKGGKLMVRARRLGRNGGVEILVEDTGIGIPKENSRKLFTPFFTTKEVGKGTGLGLWVVRSIIEEHKGTITAKSRQGKKGTLFTIHFPKHQEETSS